MKDSESSIKSYLPAILSITGAVLVVLLRIEVGGEHFPSDGALMMLALACYLTAAVFLLMNLYAPSLMAQRVGLWLSILGVFFNASSWGVRWIAARDRELAILGAGRMPWFFRYIPFANLYDLSLAFAIGAGVTTLLIAHRKSFRSLGAVTLPLAALVLLLARFIGDEFVDLQPVLDSYWRPIHVGIASLSYGVALVCFAVAVLYLLKEGVKTEAMAIWTCIFSISVIGTISHFSVLNPADLTYRATLSLMGEGGHRLLPFRLEIPYVGPVLVLAALLMIGVIICFGMFLKNGTEPQRIWGHRMLRLALVVQICAVALLMSQLKTMSGVSERVLALFQQNPVEAQKFGIAKAEEEGLTQEQIAAVPPERIEQAATDFVRQQGPALATSINANPVELAALITAAAGTLFVLVFSFKTEKLIAALPSLDRLDSLMYKTASVAFALLAMLLITGAVWANESWGHYWSWDSKETGALVAWLTYAAFLHTRIARGWTGRRSAYFALVGFLLVIFTYLGVSYLLPGLHSYA